MRQAQTCCSHQEALVAGSDAAPPRREGEGLAVGAAGRRGGFVQYEAVGLAEGLHRGRRVAHLTGRATGRILLLMIMMMMM
jgi:hypothetical protein